MEINLREQLWISEESNQTTEAKLGVPDGHLNF
jgi:hypothetical protein